MSNGTLSVPRICTISLFTTRPREIVRFYSAFGFCFTEIADRPELARMRPDVAAMVPKYRCDDGHVELEICVLKETFDCASQTMRMSFSVSDVRIVERRLEEAGYTMTELSPLGDAGRVADPDGRVVDIIEE